VADQRRDRCRDGGFGNGFAVPRTVTPTSSPATRAGRRCRCRQASALRGIREERIHQETPVLRRHAQRTETAARHQRRACPGVLGDSVTTDHISPAGNISRTSPAAKYLLSHGIAIDDFNSYGARRGNHEVMVRGTFANVRLRNALVPRRGRRRHALSADGRTDVNLRCLGEVRAAGTPLVVLAGKEYVLVRRVTGRPRARCCSACAPPSPNRSSGIHRSNLIGMGILPLEYATARRARRSGLPRRNVCH